MKLSIGFLKLLRKIGANYERLVFVARIKERPSYFEQLNPWT